MILNPQSIALHILNQSLASKMGTYNLFAKKKKKLSMIYHFNLAVYAMQTFHSWEWIVLFALEQSVNVWFVTRQLDF